MLLPFLALAATAAEVVLTVGPDGEVVAPAPPAAPISLDLVDADIRSVLRLFGAHAGIDFVVDESVKGRVTVRLVDVPWDAALAAILQAEGLVAVPVGPPGAPVWAVAPLR